MRQTGPAAIAISVPPIRRTSRPWLPWSGRVRAKQDRVGRGPEAWQQIMPVLLHGDAAFAGQGMVAEVFNLSQLRGFRTGGTLHVVVNNQIGFTTAPTSGRSSVYSTDVAKINQVTIFHVNSDDPRRRIGFCRSRSTTATSSTRTS